VGRLYPSLNQQDTKISKKKMLDIVQSRGVSEHKSDNSESKNAVLGTFGDVKISSFEALCISNGAQGLTDSEWSDLVCLPVE
jgi:hypothetical protein